MSNELNVFLRIVQPACGRNTMESETYKENNNPLVGEGRSKCLNLYIA